MLTATVPVFRPEDVFASLYADACLAAYGQIALVQESLWLSPQDLKVRTERKFVMMFQTWQSGETTLTQLHQQHLRRLKGHWRSHRSSSVCLSCLVGWCPEHRLSCGHWLCDACVQAAGTRTTANPRQYTILKCPLCGDSRGTTIFVQPILAGWRILSIDGGGVRGIIPLSLLVELERRIGIEDILLFAFDFGIGTSAGESSRWREMSRMTTGTRTSLARSAWD